MAVLMIFTANAHEEDLESAWENIEILGCIKASSSQRTLVNQGNSKKDAFLSACAKATENSPWCAQLIRPNPESLAIFHCTYGDKQIHQLIHPDEETWANAFSAIQLVEDLQKQGIQVCLIYNWWRPEPYNRNVGGAPGRHPLATSTDVRFCTKEDQEKAFLQLCEWRQQGKLRALGYYPSSALHFGISDLRPNTWGKECPRPIQGI